MRRRIAALWLLLGELLAPLPALGLLLAPLPALAQGTQPLPDLAWRLLGPFRGGWSTLAVGIPDQPDTFLAGTAGGGVWITRNAGLSWQPLSDAAGITSVGALAVAPGDTQVIYAGGGQPEPRYDIAAGDGMYRSSDGGKSWQHIGLEAVRHIGAILVDPQNPEVVTVAAQGHFFGPDRNRGIYRSEDGGKTWNQVLYIGEQTGVVDLAADPAHPQVLFAAAWQARDWPWLSYFQPMVGSGSGLYKSTDGGRNWTRLNGRNWPQGALGRIGLAVTDTAQGARIYATVDSEAAGGIWRSDDGGDSWQRVNDDADTFGNWYFARLTVAPDNPDTLYASGQSIRRSTDGGKTFAVVKGAPGGDDYHSLWINPRHPERWVAASDQGSTVSLDGGHSWSDWYNQPTGQFYHVAADQRFPYWIYSGQQDSGTVAIASRSDYGALGARDWHPVGGDERDYDIPDPADPQIVYGSGLGGHVSRWDARSGQAANISPWPVASYGKRPDTVQYRYTWITPLVATRKPPYSLLLGSQVLFQSDDRGEHWRVISPDLTGKQPAALRCEPPVAIAAARACGYGVIYTIAPSPLTNDEIWVGTDDGLVQLTRDGGRHWQEVTPKDLPAWARIDSIEPSALAPGTAYLVADNHRQDDFAPYAWRTRDYGKSWQRIDAGLPAGQFLTVLRADPQRAGLLYAGSDHGVHLSFDDGARWQPLQLNLPAAWVRDLLVHEDDLIVATQGRALWMLDDLSPLRKLGTAGDAADATHLFPPAPAWRIHADDNRDTPPPADTPLGRNPPAGAVIDYRIGADVSGPVRLEIRDAGGALVRSFRSDVPPLAPAAERYFSADWTSPEASLAGGAGLHRFVWDLHYQRPRSTHYSYSIAGVHGQGTPILPQGPYAPPGTYTLVLAAGGREYRATLLLKPDPRVHLGPADYTRALDYSQTLSAALQQAFVARGEVQAISKQLEALKPALAAEALRPLREQAEALAAGLEPLAKAKPGRRSDFGSIGTVLSALEADAEWADGAPTAAQLAVLAQYQQLLNASLQSWAGLSGQRLGELNARLRLAGLAIVSLPAPEQLPAPADDGGMDLP